MRLAARYNWKLILVAVWLIFTLSLATWWLIFGLQQNDQMQAIADASLNPKILRQHSMLLWEGGILLVFLLGGGGGLFYYTLAEIRQNRRLREFFATFSHEIKTSLTSLRLQAESLQEDLAGQPSKLLGRLVGDTVRLEIQLENSLFLANEDKRRLYPERIPLKKLLDPFENIWPGLSIELKRPADLYVDVRAFESVLKNLFYNSVHHGEANRVVIDCHAAGAGNVKVSVADNGKGFSGNGKMLGQLFARHTSSSGSGLGLYLVKRLVHEMGGRALFAGGAGGFTAELILPGELS